MSISDSNSSIRSKSGNFRILVTVGTDLPFNRLVKAVDDWAQETGHENIFAQIGETDWQPNWISFKKFIQPQQFIQMMQEVDCIVSHAGMGTILSALHYQKPLLVMPRLASLGEHRNEHQLSTAKHLSKLGRLNVARDEHELIDILNDLSSLPIKDKIGPYASNALLRAIEDFIQD